MRTLPKALLSLCLLAPLPAAAIELSLEENKAERGGVGFVDMQRLFREYPETARAKEQFEAEVGTRRLEVQRKKAEIADLQAELARLTVERERLLSEALTEPPPQAGEPPETSTPASPGLIATLPGIQTSTESVPTPMTVSTEPATAPMEVSTEAAGAQPPAAPASAAAQAASAAQRAKDMEGQIAVKQQEIDDLKKAFKEFQSGVEKQLLDLEKRRVQILLGRIYDVVQQVAKEEGVGIVVDKTSILYGQQAVDLTDKLVERLK